MVVRRVKRSQAFYSDSEDDDSGAEEVVVEEAKEEAPTSLASVDLSSDSRFQNDHKLALRASLPLLKSRNSGVVLGVCCLHFYCGSDDPGVLSQLAKALVRILRNRREIQLVILNSVRAMARQRPSMFADFLPDFFVKASDPLYNRLTKLDIINALVNRSNFKLVLSELETYLRQSIKVFVAAAVEGVYFAAQAGEDEEVVLSCIRGLQHLLISFRLDPVAGSISDVLRRLSMLLRNSEERKAVVRQLTRYILESESQSEKFLHDSAIPPIVWLTGEYCQSIISIAPDLLRYYASIYINEDVKVKTQILNATVKISTMLPENDTVQSLMMYIVECARYDTNTDLRDRSRVITAIMGMVPSTENGNEGATFSSATEDALEELTGHAKVALLGAKPIPLSEHKSVDQGSFPHPAISSLSAQTDHLLPCYRPLPPWATRDSESGMRDAKEAASGDYEEWSKSTVPTGKDGGLNLRQFYESQDSDSEEDEGSEDEESSEEDASTEEEDEDVDEEESSDDSESSDDDSPPLGKARHHNQPPPPLASSSRIPATAQRPISLLDIELPTVSPDRAKSSSTSQLSSDDRILAQLMESFPTSRQGIRALEIPPLSKPLPTSFPPQTSSSTSDVLSFPPKLILRGELSRGLQITVQYRHGILSSQIPGGSSVLITFENKKSQPIRLVKYSDFEFFSNLSNYIEG